MKEFSGVSIVHLPVCDSANCPEASGHTTLGEQVLWYHLASPSIFSTLAGAEAPDTTFSWQLTLACFVQCQDDTCP